MVISELNTWPVYTPCQRFTRVQLVVSVLPPKARRRSYYSFNEFHDMTQQLRQELSRGFSVCKIQREIR